MIAKLAVPLLALAFAGCAMALLVVIAKLQEEKERRWDETSLALTIEKEAIRAGELAAKVQEHEWTIEFGERYKIEKERDQYKLWFENCKAGNHALQDKLSALLCPHNDHVWKDGVCAKCGRAKDD